MDEGKPPPAPMRPAATSSRVLTATSMKRRKLKLKANLESDFSNYSFKRLVPGAFNVGLIGSTCTTSPR